jgi:hypothetical protein
MSKGDRGYVITSQTQCERFDLDIPDDVFQINLSNFGNERLTSQRDFINEWVYFSYLSNESSSQYNDRTLFYNYRDNSWATFYESYTSYGQFYPTNTTYTWATIGQRYPTWASWNDPWDAGATTAFQTSIIAGNGQGFVVFRDTGTSEAESLSISIYQSDAYIVNITKSNPCIITAFYFGLGYDLLFNFVAGQSITFNNVNGMIEINGVTCNIVSIINDFVNDVYIITTDLDSTTFGNYTYGGIVNPSYNFVSYNHNLDEGDFISVFGKVFKVIDISKDSFSINYDLGESDYSISKRYVPFIQTKQFPLAWDLARKTRIGSQQYLLTTTANSQITLQIYLSQDSENPYNTADNNATIYSTLLYTCPESTNLGLTPANVNLMTPTAVNQSQIWHRVNTSLIGDTVQLGFTISDRQMYNLAQNNCIAELELHKIIVDVSPSQLLV